MIHLHQHKETLARRSQRDNHYEIHTKSNLMSVDHNLEDSLIFLTVRSRRTRLSGFPVDGALGIS